MATYKGVILDVDGTLVDSNDAHARSWVEAMRESGYEVAYEQVRSLIGMGGDNLLPNAIQVEKDSERGQALAKRREQIFKERYLPGIQAFEGVQALVQRMKANGMKIAVASSGEQDEVRHLLSLAGVDDLIEAQTSSGDVENSKPDPDVIHAALGKLGMQPGEVVMLGDTPYDIEAAGKAGVRVIALRCGGFPDAELRGALAIYDNPAALLAEYDESPLHT